MNSTNLPCLTSVLQGDTSDSWNSSVLLLIQETCNKQAVPVIPKFDHTKQNFRKMGEIVIRYTSKCTRSQYNC